MGDVAGGEGRQKNSALAGGVGHGVGSGKRGFERPREVGVQIRGQTVESHPAAAVQMHGKERPYARYLEVS